MAIAYSLMSLKFWNAYWITMRPYLLFISGAAGMVGAAAAGSMPGRAAAILVPFFLSYGFGQALTDCSQTDTDSLSSPYRPLVRGLIRRRHVLGVSLAGLVLCSLLLVFLNPWTLLPAAMAVAGLATYTFFKRRWWGGPWYNAWIVALLPIMGFLAARGLAQSRDETGYGGLFPWIASVFFGYANFVLMGYFKDISADRASGYDTFVVRFGWAKAAVASDLFAMATVGASLWGWARHGAKMAVPAALVLLAGWVVLLSAQIGIHRCRTESGAYGPIAGVVRGFVLVHLGAVCLYQPGWILAAAFFYAFFELALATRPQRNQV